jgi:hypothetical protein
VALKADGTALFVAPPTTGAAASYMRDYSPLAGCRQLATLKVVTGDKTLRLSFGRGGIGVGIYSTDVGTWVYSDLVDSLLVSPGTVLPRLETDCGKFLVGDQESGDV